MREKQTEQYLKHRVEQQGGLCIKLGQNGWPDRVIVWDTGQVDFVELKALGGRLSPLQKKRIESIMSKGAKCYTLYGKGGVHEYIKQKDVVDDKSNSS